MIPPSRSRISTQGTRPRQNTRRTRPDCPQYRLSSETNVAVHPQSAIYGAVCRWLKGHDVGSGIALHERPSAGRNPQQSRRGELLIKRTTRLHTVLKRGGVGPDKPVQQVPPVCCCDHPSTGSATATVKLWSLAGLCFSRRANYTRGPQRGDPLGRARALSRAPPILHQSGYAGALHLWA